MTGIELRNKKNIFEFVINKSLNMRKPTQVKPIKKL